MKENNIRHIGVLKEIKGVQKISKTSIQDKEMLNCGKYGTIHGKGSYPAFIVKCERRH